MAKKRAQSPPANNGRSLNSATSLDSSDQSVSSIKATDPEKKDHSLDRFFRNDTPLPRLFQLIAQLQMGYSPKELNSEHPRRVWNLIEKAESLGIIKLRPEYIADQSKPDFNRYQRDRGRELLQDVLNELFPQENGAPIKVQIVNSGLPHEIVGDHDFNGPYARCIQEFVKNAVNDLRVQEWLKAIRTGGMAWGRHMYWLARFVKPIRLNQKRQKKAISPLIFPVWGHALPQGVTSARPADGEEKNQQLKKRRLRPSDIDCTMMAKSLTKSLGGEPENSPSLLRIPGVIPAGPIDYRKWFYEKYIATNVDYLRIFGPNPLLARGGMAGDEEAARHKHVVSDNVIAGLSRNRENDSDGTNVGIDGPRSTLIKEADTLLVAIGDEDAVLNYLHGLALRDFDSSALDVDANAAEELLPQHGLDTKTTQAISKGEKGIIYGDIGGSFIYQKIDGSIAKEQANIFSSIEERWAGLTLEQIHHVAVSATKANKNNGVMVWAIGRSRADVVLAAVAYGAKNAFAPYTNARSYVTGCKENSTPYQLVNQIVMDCQLAAQLLEKLQRSFVDHQVASLQQRLDQEADSSNQEEQRQKLDQEKARQHDRFQAAVAMLRGGD